MTAKCKKNNNNKNNNNNNNNNNSRRCSHTLKTPAPRSLLSFFIDHCPSPLCSSSATHLWYLFFLQHFFDATKDGVTQKTLWRWRHFRQNRTKEQLERTIRRWQTSNRPSSFHATITYRPERTQTRSETQT